jgi:hypothetical protein
VFDDGGNGVVSKVYSAANWLHVETRESLIRRELLFEEGDCVDPLRLSESERLLRGFRFLESVNIDTARRPSGDVDVTVSVRDDWTLRVEPRFHLGGGFAVSGVGLAERNLGGRGEAVELLYVDRAGRDDVGASYFDPQLLGSRWDLFLDGARTSPGWTVDAALAYPFLGLVGGWAAFQEVLYSERWFRYVVGDSRDPTTELLLPFTRRSLQLGGALRQRAVPERRATKLGTYGLTLSYEYLGFGDGFFQDGSATVAGNLSEGAASDLALAALRRRETLRLNLIVGVRGFGYVQRRGVSTLRATEDIALGASADLVLGVAVPRLGSSDSHLLVALDLYGGSRVRGNWFSVVRLNGEARRDYEARRWYDIFSALQWTNFWLVNSRSTTEITARVSAGWETTVPFQLTLGGPWGLAGYAVDRFPGGARVALRVENRYNLTTVGKLFDLASALFFDVGRMWANGAVFGENSGWRASAGAGLRIATPAGSRTTYRLQVGVPLESGIGLDDLVFELRVDRLLRLEERPVDLQLARSRDVGVRSATRYLK